MKYAILFIYFLGYLCAESIEGVGYGLTKDAAIEQAKRDAVEVGLGAYISSETVVTATSTLDTQRVSGAQRSIYLNKDNTGDNSLPINADNPDGWRDYNIGTRYGLNTETANFNPTFRINKKAGVINFSSDMAGELCILEYVSDGMEGGDDSQVSVNKLFEDYIYAHIEYSILNSKFNVQEYVINRARKRKTALLRNAKIRLSNIHPGRLLMNLRGENKWIK
jgi:hypothetical protein